MKKFITAISICAMILTTLAGCSSSNRNSAGSENSLVDIESYPETPRTDYSTIKLVASNMGDRVVIKDLAELENGAKAIVVGTFIENAHQEEYTEYDGDFKKDILINIKSINTIKVSKVLSGDVNIGDELKIVQSYGIYENRLISNSCLTPMVNGDTWLFFLGKAINGDYLKEENCWVCLGDNDGRYPVPDASYQKTLTFSNRSVESANLGVYDKGEFRQDIYNDILKKYFN